MYPDGICFKEKELDDSTYALFAHVQKEGNREVKRNKDLTAEAYTE